MTYFFEHQVAVVVPLVSDEIAGFANGLCLDLQLAWHN